LEVDEKPIRTMAKYLLTVLLLVAAINYNLGCDGNFDTVRTCMKANLPNATKMVEQIKDCYDKSGCANVDPADAATPPKKNMLTALMQLFSVLFDLNKLKECQNLFSPIVRSAVETCVCAKYPDYRFPNFTIGQMNSSFFGGDVNTSVANCSAKAQPAFAKCLNETIGNPLQTVCNAEKACSTASNPNQCTVQDVKQLVSDCAASELTKDQVKADLNAAMKQCLGISAGKKVPTIMFSYGNDISGMLVKLIQTMGKGCDAPQPSSKLQLQTIQNKLTSFMSKFTGGN